MKFDRSMGIIVFKGDKVLLTKRGGIDGWDLPKGHPNENESDLMTAKREVAEETGYKQIKILDLPIIRIQYVHKKGKDLVNKEVYFFIGEHEGEEIPEPQRDDSAREREMRAEWFEIGEARNLIEFPEMKRAFEMGLKIINKLRN